MVCGEADGPLLSDALGLHRACSQAAVVVMGLVIRFEEIARRAVR
jgi:hypothetical protein